jgi:hypothetical protein
VTVTCDLNAAGRSLVDDILASVEVDGQPPER